MTIRPAVKKFFRRFFRITLTTVFVVLGLLVLVFLLIRTPPVQRFAKNKIEGYLTEKLHTTVRIGHLYVGIPHAVVLGDVYLEDRSHDTLLSGREIAVDIDMLGLLRHEIRVDRISLEGVTAKVRRVLPDSSFNFQFIADAFGGSGEPAKPEDKTATPFRYSIGTIALHDITAVYRDDATGNDCLVRLGDFNAVVGDFDPAGMRFGLRSLDLANVQARVRQYNPILILQKAADTIAAHNEAAQPVRVSLGPIALRQIDLAYRNDAEAMDASAKFRSLVLRTDSIDLQKMAISIGEIDLAGLTAAVRQGKKTAPKTSPKTAAEASQPAASWRIGLARVRLDENALAWDDDNKPRTARGIDYHHLALTGLTLHADSLAATPGAYSGRIAALALREERSGFAVKQASAFLRYDSSAALIRELVLLTNRSALRIGGSAHYSDPGQFSRDAGKVRADLTLDHNRIAAADVLTFVPSLAPRLKGMENAVLLLNGKASGRIGDLHVSGLEISGIGATDLAIAGDLRGLPDARKAFYDLRIQRFRTTRADLQRFIPASALPPALRLPGTFAASGLFRGTASDFAVNLHANTSQGSADIVGRLDLGRKTYDLRLHTRALDLGYLLKQDTVLGKYSLDATAKGTGFDPKTMRAVLHAQLREGGFRGYIYRGLDLDATAERGQADVQARMAGDPNIAFDLRGRAGFLSASPSVNLDLTLDTLNLQALHFVSDTLAMRLGLHADFASTNPDSLAGKLLIHDVALTRAGLATGTDSITLESLQADTGATLKLRAEMASVDLTGKYKLTQIAAAVEQVIGRYYALPGKHDTAFAPEDWRLAATLRPSPMVLALVPALNGTDSLRAAIAFDSRARDLRVDVAAPKIVYAGQTIHDLALYAETADTSLVYAIGWKDAGKKGFMLHQSALRGDLAHNRLRTMIDLRDAKGKEHYRLGGELTQVPGGVHFVFNPDSLLLHYDKWSLPAENYVQYDSTGLIVKNLRIGNAGEVLAIGSRSPSGASPLDLSFEHFRLRTLTDFAEQDSLLADGTIDGRVEVRHVTTSPVFTSDLKIRDLSWKTDTVGDLALKVDNESANAFAADIRLTGRDNDVAIEGKYFTGESRMDMNVNLNRLNLASVKGFASEQVRDLSGYLKGTIRASGSPDKPVLKGGLHFEDAKIVPDLTGEPLKLSRDTIEFDEDGFNFSQFAMSDSAGNEATLDGNVYTKDFRDYRFDLSLAADNFTVINTRSGPGREFYGRMNIDSRIDVLGDLNLPKINARLRVNKNTDFTVVLPSDDPEVVDRQGVVVFQDSKTRMDTVHMRRFLDSLSAAATLKGMDLSATIETDSNALFTMIIDERNGDALSVRGRAELAGGIDKSGKTSLTGTYEIENGTYGLTLSLLHRKFTIARGSSITWTGDPTKANIDITAYYTVMTPSIDLVEEQLAGRPATEVNKFKQRLPFQVKLSMSGELLQPIVKFDISLPDDQLAVWPDVDIKLQQLRSDVAETNKQVFALLLLNRFVSENPFSSASDAVNAGTLARQSASKILSDQLNQLAGSLVKGVDLTFDLNSTDDYSTGTRQNQTDLNVGLSKNLFSDRVRVTIGSDFQLEQTAANQNASNIAGDVSVDYRLSKDGRYMLRAYRKNQYETIVEGQVVETGVSFILTFDYNKFHELFEKPRDDQRVDKPKRKKVAPAANSSTKR